MESEKTVLDVMRELEAAGNFDARFGTNTRPEPPRATGWQMSISSLAFTSAMSTIQMNHSEFVFVDIGSGKGRAVMLASEYPFRRCIGVERDPEWCAVAEQNLALWKSPEQKCRDLQLVCADVLTWDYPHEDLFLFYYNALSTENFMRLLDVLKASLASHPRRVIFNYHVPSDDELLSRSGLFHRWGPQGAALHYGRGAYAPKAPLPVYEGTFPFTVYSNF